MFGLKRDEVGNLGYYTKHLMRMTYTGNLILLWQKFKKLLFPKQVSLKIKNMKGGGLNRFKTMTNGMFWY
jgi:hypothetical protein